MDISIKTVLSNYNDILMQIKFIINQIKYYDDLLRLPDLSDFEYYKEQTFLGLKYKSPVFSIVEKEAFTQEKRHKLNYDIIFSLRNAERKKILKLKKQINIINSSLRSLNFEDRYVLECKFIDNRKLTYDDIARNFYEKFKYYLDKRSIKRRVAIAIKKIEKNIQVADIDLNKTLNLNKNYLKL